MFKSLIAASAVALAQGATIVDLAVATPDLSTLVAAVTAAKLVDTLASPGPFTVFAPTNEAFSVLPKAYLDFLLEPDHIDDLTDLLTYHVVSGAAHAADLKDDEKIPTVEGQDVSVTLYDNKVLLNCFVPPFGCEAEVQTADVDASNGVVHIIDHVLVPPRHQKYLQAAADPSIVELALATPDLSTLVTALTAGKLVDTLSGAGPFTVFAPTNEAFAKLPKSVLDHLLDPANIKELDDILTYHVAAGKVESGDLSNNEKIPTVEGKDVEVFIKGGKVYIDDAQVLTADVEASNGVVHIIDTVLIPPAYLAQFADPSIVDLAVATPDLSTLVAALQAGALVDTLSGAGPFTVFAPTNEAFAKLPKSVLDHLLEPANIKELDDVLTYHVAAGKVESKDLSNREKIPTVEGKDVEVFIYGGKVYIDRAEVLTADVEASNGVVHIINEVLIPPKYVAWVQQKYA